MKVENTLYILTSDIKGETIYLTEDKSGYDYSFDIHDALKAGNKATALVIKDEYEDEVGAQSDLKIVPLKITYEW